MSKPKKRKKTTVLGCSHICTLSCKDKDTCASKNAQNDACHGSIKRAAQPKYIAIYTKTFLLTCLVVALSLDFGTFAVPRVLAVALPGRLSAPVALRSWKTQMPFLHMPLNASSWSSRLDVLTFLTRWTGNLLCVLSVAHDPGAGARIAWNSGTFMELQAHNRP